MKDESIEQMYYQTREYLLILDLLQQLYSFSIVHLSILAHLRIFAENVCENVVQIYTFTILIHFLKQSLYCITSSLSSFLIHTFSRIRCLTARFSSVVQHDYCVTLIRVNFPFLPAISIFLFTHDFNAISVNFTFISFIFYRKYLHAHTHIHIILYFG